MYNKFIYSIVAIFGLLSGVHHTLSAAPSLALGYETKYPVNFTHFDYVNPDAPKGGSIKLSGFGSFDSLNPYLIKGVAADGLGLLYETLMVKSLDEPFSMYGLLAEDIELAEDKLSVTFKLNPKARFSDGSEVTAEDVKYSLTILRSKPVHPLYKMYWSDIQHVDILDKYTIKFNFTKINPELHLIVAELPIFSKQAMQGKSIDNFVTKPLVGSGPYVVDEYQSGRYITYKRNPHYWAAELNTRKGMYNFDHITYKYYKDREVSLEAFKSGEFDYMDVYNSKNWAREFKGLNFDNGNIIKTTLSHKNNAGMQGFIFNLRKPLFQDIRVRKAINLAFDFEWTNKNLFYGQYKRCNSYFSNSELAATGEINLQERALLEALQQTYPKQFPTEVLSKTWQPVSTAPPHDLRQNLHQAARLLKEAGWKIKNGVLHDADNKPFTFEVMLSQPSFNRVVAPFVRNLKRLGIKVSYRVVDFALYEKRLEKFDFDMTTFVFGQSQSPGNELINKWHSSSLQVEGSSNLIGLSNPLIDTLIEKVIDSADNRAKLVAATRALDRILLYGEYLVPNWYVDKHRVSYWNKFEHPNNTPLYYAQGQSWFLSTWWMKPQVKSEGK